MTKTPKISDEEALAKLDEGRPIAGESTRPVSDEVLSHQWQPNSPAIDTNVNSESLLSKESIMTKIDTKENIELRKNAAVGFEFGNEDIDPSKRDVSDPGYAQPGSEKHKEWKKANK